MKNPTVAQLACVVTRRETSMFDGVLRQLHDELATAYEDARVLVTGGAGFIAGQTLRTILPFRPRTIVVADHDENNLAELVRDLRTSGAIHDGTRLLPRLVDVTGPLIERLIAEVGPFDTVLAFAACKHVRSERDATSALHMLDVNINGTIRPVRAVKAQNPDCQVFVVSTDKAADPASMMGASKRVMEMLTLGLFPEATTTRFANVAFSSGSLLDSWLIRLANGQVLPVPRDTHRYFVTPEESGQLCALASIAPGGSIVIPEPAAVGMSDLQLALERVLASYDLIPNYVDEATALGAQPTAQSHPILVTKRDTPGEKAAEVFLGARESSRQWIDPLLVVQSPNDLIAAQEFAQWVTEAASLVHGPSLSEIESALGGTLQRFEHVTGSSSGLDDRI